MSDKDAARAVRAALAAPQSGIYNIAGSEAVPLSVLAHWTGRSSVPVPSTLLGWVGTGLQWLGSEAAHSTEDTRHLRYGFTLDTRRAERELGFRPGYRVGLARAGDGALRLEAAPI